jgi:hypothetical protein
MRQRGPVPLMPSVDRILIQRVDGKPHAQPSPGPPSSASQPLSGEVCAYHHIGMLSGIVGLDARARAMNVEYSVQKPYEPSILLDLLGARFCDKASRVLSVPS